MKLEEGDVVYNSETDKLGYICAVHKTPGCITSYNILWDWKTDWYFQMQCTVYLIDQPIHLISKGDFK